MGCEMCCPTMLVPRGSMHVPGFDRRQKLCNEIDMPVLALVRAPVPCDARLDPTGTERAANVDEIAGPQIDCAESADVGDRRLAALEN